jgi:hypothetical protein
VDRIEVMGRDAVVVGADSLDLHFSGIRLADQPTVTRSFTLPGAAEGESRSHGFFYREDGPTTGVLALAVAKADRARWEQLFRGSASVLFLRNASGSFRQLGQLTADTVHARGDACLASCVDWYGNARPIFIEDRVFALLGYELVEGVLADRQLREIGRLDFTPDQALALASLPSGPHAPQSEAIWETLLRAYENRAMRTVADSVAASTKAPELAQVRSAPVVLMAGRNRGGAPYFRPWMDSLTARNLIDAICPAAEPSDCTGKGLAIFLDLGDPQFSGSDTATVAVAETATNPQHCTVLAFAYLAYRLERAEGRWKIAKRDTRWSGSWPCRN